MPTGDRLPPARLGTSIIVLIGISIFVYLLLHAIYPSQARAFLGLRANNAQINAWNQENGFSRPVIERSPELT